MTLREKPISWEVLDGAIELTKRQLNNAVVDREYFYSLVEENLEFNYPLIEKIIEERRKEKWKTF